MYSNGTITDVKCNEVFLYVCYRNMSENEVLTECGTVDRDYHLESRTGSCYKFHLIARNWTRAFMTCAAEGAYLAIINSDAEAEFLKELFTREISTCCTFFQFSPCRLRRFPQLARAKCLDHYSW
ncbi:unnamed protein product [Pieris brassicae]|uniref:C-type lectin domain-containing protein n=1 Tax=Pieris brassicae TaxID=7116 RepID=A0A9P0T931_PIEBR|nr:unnamed protein product [Pieris brassicae]